MNTWSARARLTWTGVTLAGALALVVSAMAQPATFPAEFPAEFPAGVASWLLLLAMAVAATLLALRPVELGPDRKVIASSAPLLALALLYPPFPAAAACAVSCLATQLAARRRWPVAVFAVAQTTLAVASAAWAATALTGAGAPGLAALAGAAMYFAVNTGCVAAMVAARRGERWRRTWGRIVQAEGMAEAGLLSGGALLATLANQAPGALPLLIPPVWLAWRALADTAEIRRLNERLESSLAGQRRFVADAAHELRTPTASARAQLEALRRELPAAAPAAVLAPLVDGATRELGRMSEVLANLLTLARADEGAPIARQLVDLEALLVDVYREARPLAGEVRLRLAVGGAGQGGDDPGVAAGGGGDAAAGAGAAEAPPLVLGDAERLRQLFLNLVTNALRFTPAGGTVELHCCSQGAGVAVMVADTGIGIAEADQQRIFERFYAASASRSREGGAPGGAGLGLAIARWIAEAHGGRIAVQSAPGQGSTFTVWLPLAPAASPGTNSVPAAAG
jgi:signal transduction histidine kinase